MKNLDTKKKIYVANVGTAARDFLHFYVLMQNRTELDYLVWQIIEGHSLPKNS